MKFNLTDHYVKLAGEVFCVRCRFPRTASQYTEYEISEAEAAVTAKGQITLIYPTIDEIRASKRAYLDSCIRDGAPVIDRSKSEYENVTLMHSLADALVERGILLMHGSVVVVDGKAYLFTARSGTGKSTHVQRWMAKFGDRAYILNDDRPLIKVGENGVTVYGSPWMGKHRRGINGSAELAGIAEIYQAAENRIEAVGAEDAFLILRKHSYRSKRESLTQCVFDLHRQLAERIPYYHLYCNMEQEAADVAYEGMVER